MSRKVTTDESEDRSARPGRARGVVRSRLARVVRAVFGLLATVLALGAVLVALGSDTTDNAIVGQVLDVAEAISGPFSRTDGIFSFRGEDSAAKNALFNWGVAAIVYLVLGRLLAGAVAPKGSR